LPVYKIVALAPTQTLAGIENVESGDGLTVIICVVSVEVHPPCATVKVTFLLPAVDQETECGPTKLELLMLAPDPKFQVYVAPVLGAPTKLITEDCPSQTFAGNVKSYTPAAFIVTDVVVVELQEPNETVKLIFLVPPVDHCKEYGPALEPLKT
jgi:hypothetical protein